ncbi:MAG: hypothetical protein ACOVOA_00595 [Allorhizobium sp.]
MLDVVQQGFLGAAETDLMVGIAWDEIYGAAQKHALLAGYGDALRRVLCVLDDLGDFLVAGA